MTHIIDEAGAAGDRHALYVGWVAGRAAKHGLDIQLTVDPDGNYTHSLLLVLPGGRAITLVVPPPPDDWTPDGGAAPVARPPLDAG